MIFLKGAIFDVDGTILDSMSVWYDITDRYFREHGIMLSGEAAAKIEGMTLEESLPYIQHTYLPQLSAELILEELRARVAFEYANNIPAKEGVCEYIRRLHENGIKIAAATSGFSELCKTAFRRIGIEEYFSAYAFSSEVGCSKSQPDIYLLAAQRLSLEPKDCCVYEDLITGVISAGSAGFTVVAVADSSNAQDRERLIRHSDHYITGWDELLSKI